MIKYRFGRAISSAVEHSPHTGGATGSIPVSPTIHPFLPTRMRELTALRAFVGIAALAGILSWSPEGHASHCPDAPGTQATRAVEVQRGDHLVIMEYNAGYGTSKDELKPEAAVPDLTVQPYDLQYDSESCEVLRRHVEWLVGMGVDAIAVDLSRNVRCVFHETEVDGQTCGSFAYPKMKRNLENLYKYFYEYNVPIRIVPLLGA